MKAEAYEFTDLKGRKADAQSDPLLNENFLWYPEHGFSSKTKNLVLSNLVIRSMW